MPDAYLNAIPSALIAVDRTLIVRFINPAAEMLFRVSTGQIVNRELMALPAMTSKIGGLCERAFASCEEISLFEHELLLPFNHRVVTMHITPVVTGSSRIPSQLLITIEKSSRLDQVAASEWKHEATRAAGIMAAMLAHEVKNPLSGIRGAAQLLKDEITPEHQPLAGLICTETDRIRDLLAQVEIFSDGVPERQPVNIHEVLQYVIEVARNGFAHHITFKERYDPSLPPVLGHHDLLVQLFLNLVKNSAEAMASQVEATITITTGYRSFSRVRLGRTSTLPLPLKAGVEGKAVLPIMVSIEDNGPGIAEPIREHLFEPFMSSKEGGRGLGLAIVAKIASDLGAVAELDKEFEGGTRFMVCFAVA